MVPRHGGEFFIISPWALTWDDENYYLIAYDEWNHQIKNYCVDKMRDILSDIEQEGIIVGTGEKRDRRYGIREK